MGENRITLQRAELIRQHPLFQSEYARLQRMEQGRIYCGHDMAHFLDVARACWIRVLEQGLDLKKDIVYAAALLHDIGKGQQYEFGTPHHLKSAELAQTILPDCGYSADEIQAIILAIRLHRKPSSEDAPLVRLLYEADKQTRLCFCCAAGESCNWPEEKKNNTIC